ncbi:MAG TPA: CFI-box-CTERM domain-containing protein [Nitrosopumilaceae archaeon]|nr:CFI-box-CTERM domain-containing protein [Nitrosopumilaceae archaeon]
MRFQYFVILLPFMIYPTFAQSELIPNVPQVLPTDQGTLNVGFTTIPAELFAGDTAKLQIDFLNTKTNEVQPHIDYRVTVTSKGETVFGPIPLTHTGEGSVKIPVEVNTPGDYFVLIEIEGILFQPIPLETVSFKFSVAEAQTGNESQNGGCLIATATFGSELAPQVQLLREIRDNTVLSTASGTAFMSTFNQFYYTFSPTIADWERQNPVFKETVKIAITPMIVTLSVLDFADIDSEGELVGSGIGVILLNFGMYFVIPAFIITKIFHFRGK